MLLSGLAGIILVEIYAAVMQREFQNTDNRVGKGFAILGIYLFVVAYCASASLIVSRRKMWLTEWHRWNAKQHDLVIRR